MAKLLLLSVILVATWLPIRMARLSNPRRGLRRTVQTIALYNLFYLFAVLVIYPRISG